VRARELRLLAIAMGGLALVVAARGGDQSSDEAGADSAGESDVVAGDQTSVGGLGGDLSELVSGRAIRLLNFSELDQRGNACAAVPGEAPSTIRVTGGESAVLDQEWLSRLVVDEGAIYGDLDGDGSDEAVVHTVCEFGANGMQDQIQVWDVATGTGSPRATLDEAPADLGGRFAPTVKDVAVDDGSLAVTWSHYADTDPRCCASQESVVRYQLSDDQFEQVGEAETTTVG
jgi:LppP/LprE lipoprotein